MRLTHEEEKKMAISPITYSPVSEGSLPKPQVGTTDEAQKLKQQEINDVQKPQSGVTPDHKRFDTYEKSDEKLPASETGIYHLSKDEDGNPKIVFDAPDRMEKDSDKLSDAEDNLMSDEAPQKVDGSDSPKEEPETTQCITNTDKVDKEIKKLKEERKQILQELGKAGEDEEKQADLQKRLSELDAELQAKDNDAYRKQHATHTTGKAE